MQIIKIQIRMKMFMVTTTVEKVLQQLEQVMVLVVKLPKSFRKNFQGLIDDFFEATGYEIRNLHGLCK